MDKPQADPLQPLPTSSENSTESQNQPDYSCDSQVDIDASFVGENLDAQVPMQNSIQNAQFNINNPVMPVKDMVKLEEAHNGAIDRILTITEKEQAFTHKIVQSQHDEQLKISERNIEISKEQNTFNFHKLYIVSGFIIVLIGCAVYLFAHDKLWGGIVLAFASLVLASIFMLGYFPTRIFEALFNRKPPDNPE